MTKFQFINNDLSRLKKEIELGIASNCTLRHYEIYCRYDYYRKQGYNIMTSALYAGDDFNITDNWVFRIIKNMEKEI